MTVALDDVRWKLVGGAAGAVAGAATRAVLTKVWRSTRHAEPPENPASPSTSWPEAVAWAAVSGVTLGVARLVAQRGAASAWQAARGSLPGDVAASGAPA